MDPSAREHEEMAIHAVHEASVARDQRIEIFDVVRPLDGRGQEATEWSHDTRERCQYEGMELHRLGLHNKQGVIIIWQRNVLHLEYGRRVTREIGVELQVSL